MEKLINNFFEIEIKNGLAIILFKNDVFELLINEEYNDLLYDALGTIRSQEKIKGVLFHNIPGVFGKVAYANFIHKILPNGNLKNINSSSFKDKEIRFKEIYTLNRFVKYISDFNKLCFSVLSGDVVTPIFGIFLATDIRYATNDMNAVLSHSKFGLHPSGGLPFFLSQELGYNKALELLLSNEISSEKLLNLGLINSTISNDDYLTSIIKEIEKIIKYSNSTLRKTKQLTAYSRNSLHDYFEYESTLLNLS